MKALAQTVELFMTSRATHTDGSCCEFLQSQLPLMLVSIKEPEQPKAPAPAPKAAIDKNNQNGKKGGGKGGKGAGKDWWNHPDPAWNWQQLNNMQVPPMMFPLPPQANPVHPPIPAAPGGKGAGK